MEKRVEEGLPRGNETILVMEDNHEVREVTRRILRMQGYMRKASKIFQIGQDIQNRTLI